MKPSEIGNALGIQVGIVVAGFAGGVVSTLFATNLTRVQAVGSILASVLVTSYATPAAIIYFNITVDPYKYGLGFLIGLFAMSLVPAAKQIGNKWITHETQRVQGLAPPTVPPPSGQEPKP